MNKQAIATLVIALFATDSFADGNVLDHRLKENRSGLYRTDVQDAIPVALTLSAAGCALWRGGQDILGRTCWESAESVALSGAATIGLQYLTGRRSPAETDDPDRWFDGGRGSFPSLHVAATTAAVTPFVFRYAHDEPWVTTLLLLPAYESVARVKSREHWQSDVLAGLVIGGSVGWLESHFDSPVAFRILPDGLWAGFQKNF